MTPAEKRLAEAARKLAAFAVSDEPFGSAAKAWERLKDAAIAYAASQAGAVTSPAKTAAARANGAKGGRPQWCMKCRTRHRTTSPCDAEYEALQAFKAETKPGYVGPAPSDPKRKFATIVREAFVGDWCPADANGHTPGTDGHCCYCPARTDP